MTLYRTPIAAAASGVPDRVLNLWVDREYLRLSSHTKFQPRHYRLEDVVLAAVLRELEASGMPVATASRIMSAVRPDFLEAIYSLEPQALLIINGVGIVRPIRAAEQRLSAECLACGFVYVNLDEVARRVRERLPSPTLETI